MLPFLNIFGLKIPAYGFLMMLGFMTSAFISARRTKNRGYCVENLIIMGAFIVGFAMLGGSVLFLAVTYSWSEIWTFIKAGEFDLLFGGIVFYGALIGGVIGGIVGCRVAKEKPKPYVDIVVPTIPLGHALGRVGCFCAGCCYGAPTEGPLGVIYKNPIGGAPTGIPLLPVQLFEAAGDIVIFGVLMLVSKKSKNPYATAYVYCMLYGVLRFVLEYFRYDSIRGHALGISTSQWISIGLIAGAAIVLTVTTVLKKKKENA